MAVNLKQKKHLEDINRYFRYLTIKVDYWFVSKNKYKEIWNFIYPFPITSKTLRKLEQIDHSVSDFYNIFLSFSVLHYANDAVLVVFDISMSIKRNNCIKYRSFFPSIYFYILCNFWWFPQVNILLIFSNALVYNTYIILKKIALYYSWL